MRSPSPSASARWSTASPRGTAAPPASPAAKMPLTPKGKKILAAMKGEYGAKRGKQVFYASQNKGTIKGTHRRRK